MNTKELIKILNYVQKEYPNEELLFEGEFLGVMITKENGAILYEWENEEINTLEDFLIKFKNYAFEIIEEN